MIDPTNTWCQKTMFEHKHEMGHLFMHIFAGVLAGYIAYRRNEKDGAFMQILWTVVAFLFGFIYLLYYIMFVQMGNVWGESASSTKDFLASSYFQ